MVHYRFLEDVGRTADAAARHCIVHSPATKRLLYCLRNKARGCNIELKTLPVGFTKRRENSTTFNSMVPDDKTLADILKPYIDPVESDPVVCQRLKIYTASPQSDVRILMKIENRNRNSVSAYHHQALVNKRVEYKAAHSFDPKRVVC
ncbi:hypothetical protein IHE44_0014956 [Lamprotornis superbus]|uniref:BCD1 alpha/beta domain-containing protein n=1 Tax=Lamprotornis superbus TaxID=245042 RepID=A0A835U0T7_9PASS|nr:hypothetical protein IHE44_0014956 [Lamprotornis superbus]